MDATRCRRTRDPVRQRWYALSRSRRFARFLDFKPLGEPREKSKPTHRPE